MEKLNLVLNSNKRSIEISYKVEDEKHDKDMFHSIVEVVRQNKLSCIIGDSYNGLRYFHISGIFPQDVIKAYNSIEKLT